MDQVNRYNFGQLMNTMLGNLYQSHGCLHVSPRNIMFLYRILPVGASLNIRKYEEKFPEQEFDKIPFLADMIDTTQSLDTLAKQMSDKKSIRVEVFPMSGIWIIYKDNKPFAKLFIEGGPKGKMYILAGREKNGMPIFEKEMAYPTAIGDFFIFKKVTNYLSRLYKERTEILNG